MTMLAERELIQELMDIALCNWETGCSREATHAITCKIHAAPYTKGTYTRPQYCLVCHKLVLFGSIRPL